jgi:lysophospholipase L1-like esterase
VTGDSHTDGVVYNAESFPNVLEEKLNAGSSSPRFEVINGGVGYYTFQNYAGFLRRHIDLQPDYFIVTVYLGNDFMEAIQFATKRGLIPAQTRSWWYGLRLWRAPGPMLSQAGNQLVYFDTYPEMKAKSLEIARQEIRDIQDICLQSNIQLLVVLLPTRLDVEEKARRDAANNLRLTDAQMDLNQSLKRTLIDDLGQAHVSYLDLTDYLRGAKSPLFWNQDYHLNDKGHALVADTLFARLGPALIPGSPATTPLSTR